MTRGPRDRPVGRPRDPDLDARIMDATREQIVRHGYRDLQIAAVASAAGVTPPTVRLRWPTKAQLVHDALFTDADEPPMPDTGTLAGDITVAVGVAIAVYSTPEIRAGLLGLVQDVREHPELRLALHARLRDPAVTAFGRVLARAVERGELPRLPRAGAETILDVIAGAVISRVLVLNDDVRSLETELSDLILRGIGAVTGDEEAPRAAR